jgi:hypothetical protein
MDVQTKVLSYELVIEKQHILHMLAHHVQHNILNIYILFPFPFEVIVKSDNIYIQIIHKMYIQIC